MMRKLLTLKSWQLFSLMVTLFVVLQIPTFGSFFFNNNKWLFLFPVVMVVIAFLFFGWFYILATGLHKKLPLTVTMNLNRFKAALLIPATYLILISASMGLAHTNLRPDWLIQPSMTVIIVLLHFISMFCIFYCLYFTAKALKSVEWQKPVNFGDFAGEFFLIWFFPLGVWIIQPRINNLFNKQIE